MRGIASAIGRFRQQSRPATARKCCNKSKMKARWQSSRTAAMPAGEHTVLSAFAADAAKSRMTSAGSNGWIKDRRRTVTRRERLAGNFLSIRAQRPPWGKILASNSDAFRSIRQQQRLGSAIGSAGELIERSHSAPPPARPKMPLAADGWSGQSGKTQAIARYSGTLSRLVRNIEIL